MKEELQLILDRWEYDKAVEWFCKHVPGRFFVKEMLKSGEDSYNTLKLKSELNQLLQELQEETLPEANSPIPQKSIPEPPNPKVVNQAPESMQELHIDQEWKPIYKTANFKHSQITINQTDEERKAIAFEILDMMDEVEQLWEKKRFVKQYGVMPDYQFQGLESMTELELSKRRNTLRTYISKAKKGTLKAEKIPGWESEIAEIERRMRG